MSTTENLQTLLHFTTIALERNLDGISEDESLAQPAGGNCVNWIIGHILATRNHIHRIVGDEPIWSAGDAARYERGTKPIAGREPGVFPLSRLITDLRASSERLKNALDRLSDDDLLARPSEDAPSRGEPLVGLFFHEAYHAGQIGLLRRIIGKDGAIR